MTKWLIGLMASVFLFSCRNTDNMPKGVMPAEKMQAVLWEVIRAESFTNQFVKAGSTTKAWTENARLQKQIFTIHQTTREDFCRSFDYYKKHSGLLKVIMDSMISKAGRERTYSVNHMPVFSIPANGSKTVK